MEQQVVVGFIGILLAGWGWYLKRTIESVEEKHAQIVREIQDIKDNYLRKEDFKEFRVEIRDMFREIKEDIKELKHP